MSDKLRPGYTPFKDLWDVKPPRIKRYMNNVVIPFLDLPKDAVCLDVGEVNPRMQYMKWKMKLDVDQWDTEDLNFDSINIKNHYDAIFAFDIIEHLQCSMHTIRELKVAVKDGGSIYINLPENSRWLWGVDHYFELDRKHLEKWILTPLGLKVVRHKRIIFVANWRAVFIGIRPLLRVLRGEDSWKSIVRSILCVHYRIYEIKKNEQT